MAEESPLVLVYLILANSGIMVPPGTRYPTFFKFYCYTHALLLTIFIITNFYHIAIGEMALEERLGVSQHTLSCVHIAAKHIDILLKPVRVQKYLKELEDMWKEAIKNNENLHVFKKYTKSAHLSASMLIGSFVGLMGLIIITCIYLNLSSTSKEWILPMETWVPLNPSKYYWICSLFQLLPFYSLLLSVGTTKSFQRILVLQMRSQMIVLERRLKNRNKYGAETHKEMYNLHQQILRMVKETNQIFGHQYMFEMALSSLQVAIRLYACFLAFLTKNPMLGHSLLNLVLTLVGPYMICWDGTILSNEAERVWTAAYQNGWYEEKHQTGRDLLTLLTMATRPVNLRYRLVFPFSHVQFTTLMQATYSYLMMIKYFTDNQ